MQSYFRCMPRNLSLPCNLYNFHFSSINCFSSWNTLKQDYRIPVRKRTLKFLADQLFPNDQKVLDLKLLQKTLNSVDFKSITSEDGKLLLQCCGSASIDSSRHLRNELCQKIYRNILDHNKPDFSIYHSYIKTCTENGVLLNWREVLAGLKHKPDEKTHKLLLENVCESGAIEDAFALLEVIKKEGYSVDESVFASLVLVHTLKGGLRAAETVLLTMKTAHVPETDNTKLALLKGILKRKDYNDFKKFLTSYPLNLNENQLLGILEGLGLNGDISWLQEMNVLYSSVSRDFTSQLKNVCIHLVHMNKSKNAMKILEHFTSSSIEDDYGIFILEEMLHCHIETDEVISLTKYLRDKQMNPYVFERLTGFTLENRYEEAAWSLLENLGELRPHYFWPLLVIAHQVNGESGLLEVIRKMMKMGSKPNPETLEQYVLPFCNLDDTKSLVQKLVNLGLTVKEILSSVMLVLLQNGKIKEAADLCCSYKVDISGENLFRLISLSWSQCKDSSSTVLILQKYCEFTKAENDLVGDFLISSLELCKTAEDLEDFNGLLKLLKQNKLRITTRSAESLCNIPIKCENTVSLDIQKSIDDLLEFKTKPEPQFIPHPNEMTLEELECHLLELQEKNMETRGVLRKLIQLHSRLGNSTRAEQLRKIFEEAGYEETLGMKSAMMHSYATGGHLEPALDAYREIKKSDPEFLIDSFKVIDLATLLVKADRSAEALDVMEGASKLKVLGGPTIQRNCLELLKAYKDEHEQKVMFRLLIDEGYCKENNIILGALVRIHMNNGDLEKAASTYISLTEKYKCTPLQLEVIRELVKKENVDSLQSVLNATKAVHGYNSTQAVLIAALAENGQEKALMKVIATQKPNVKKALMARCERWVKEGKLAPLKILAKCCERLSNDTFDMNIIFRCIMKIHSINNDCESALKFYEHLMERELPIPREIEDLLYKLLKYNNYTFPKFLNRC